MPSLQYQVAIVHQGRLYFAHLFDLRCEGIGLTVEEAVTQVYEQARVVLEKYEEDGSFVPPSPSGMTIANMELPMPRVHGSRRSDASAA